MLLRVRAMVRAADRKDLHPGVAGRRAVDVR
jgi:hypothetical protein